jgi:hypothetical protein
LQVASGCRSPRLVTFNANLHRRFRLGCNEKRSIDLGVNPLNAFNHPIFFLPGNSGCQVFSGFNTASINNPNVPAFTVSPTLGFLSAANTEGLCRVVQLGVKFHW